MARRGRGRGKKRRIKSGSMQERGNLWVPVNISAATYNPFEVKFNMTKSDKLFLEMEYRFAKETLKRTHAEQTMSFLSPFKTFHEERRSKTYDLSIRTRPYPSGSCHMFIIGNCSESCVSGRLTWIIIPSDCSLNLILNIQIYLQI